ncbi:MAG: NYN domain-containing protein [Planctomycetaceae bacterium]
MAHPFILIDGYNLMHAVGIARRRYGPGDLEVCRNRLLQQLAARLTPAAVERTTVVFDAFGSDDDSRRRQVQHGVIVIYAPAGTDADSELERIVAADSSPKQLLVVSSDHRLHRAARRRKAKVIDSEVFWESLDPESVRSAGPHPHQRQQTDTAFWLQQFADVDSDPNGAAAAEDGVFDSDYLADLESEFGD